MQKSREVEVGETEGGRYLYGCIAKVLRAAAQKRALDNGANQDSKMHQSQDQADHQGWREMRPVHPQWTDSPPVINWSVVISITSPGQPE